MKSFVRTIIVTLLLFSMTVPTLAANISVGSTGNKTYKATWEKIKTLNITFNPGNAYHYQLNPEGTAGEINAMPEGTITRTYGEAYETLPAPKLFSGEFIGWFTEKEGGKQITSDSIVDTTGTQVLYARVKDKTVTTIYDANGGTLKIDKQYVPMQGRSNYKEYKFATEIEKEEYPDWDETHYFDGWYDEKLTEEQMSRMDELEYQYPTNSETRTRGQNQTYYAIYRPYTKITFNYNDGINTKVTKYYKRGRAGSGYYSTGVLPVPERKGFKFDGWYYDDREFRGDSSKILSDKEVIAHWKEVRLCFDLNYDKLNNQKAGVNVSFVTEKCTEDGSNFYSTNKVYDYLRDGSWYKNRDGYQFDGWYSEPVGGVKVDNGFKLDFNSMKPCNDFFIDDFNEAEHQDTTENAYYLTAYAHWTKVSNVSQSTSKGSYAILRNQGVKDVFLNQLDSDDKVKWMDYNQKGYVDVPKCNWSAYTFMGYYTMPTSGGVQYFDAKGSAIRAWDKTTDLVLYARWAKNKSIKLAFYKDKGTGGTNEITVDYINSLPTISVPAKEGYKFEGYFGQNTNEEQTGKAGREYQYYDSTGKPVRKIFDGRHDMTGLYALWTPLKYNVTLNANGGKVPGADKESVTYTVTYGSNYMYGVFLEKDGRKAMGLPIPERDGYVFTGWYNAKTGGTKFNEDVDVTTSNPSALYAQWAKADTYSSL